MTILEIVRVCARARVAARAAILALVLLSPPPAYAEPLSGGITVEVASSDGRPIPGALITVHGSAAIQTFRSDLHGNAALSDLVPGVYVVSVTAPGFAPLGGNTIAVLAGQVTDVQLELSPSTSSLVVLGRVTTKSGEALTTSSVPSQELASQKYSASGGTSVADLISQDAVSVTVIRPAGGNPAAPAVVALRGPDPTETLVDVDGHPVNSGGTGSFDLSLVDPAELAGVQLVYGISPSSLVGPNTIDGAINVRTIDPTMQPAGLVRVSAGSYGAFGATLQATGTAARFGYAFSVHRTSTQGEVTGQSIVNADGDTDVVGSAVDGSTGLLKLRFGLGLPGSYVGLTLRDQSEYRDLSAALSSIAAPGADGGGDGAAPHDEEPPVFNSFAGSSLRAHGSAYGLDLQMPLGQPSADGQYPTTAVFRHQTSLGDQSVEGPASSTTPYLFNTHDFSADDTLQFDRTLPKGTLSVKFDLRSERLNTQTLISGTPDQSRRHRQIGFLDENADPQPLPELTQSQNSAVVRYAFDTTPKLHYSAAVYFSHFTSFGSSTDPRVGVVWTPTAQTAVRGSVGTTFQSPQLPELYVPTELPPPDADGFINVGNPNLKADHATDFDLGFSRVLSAERDARIDIDLYQTNVRTPAVRFVPSTQCLPPLEPSPECESFPINGGGAVYRGFEFRAERSIAEATLLRFAYSVNSSFLTSVSPDFQDGSLVPGEQTIGVPLHRAVLSVQRDTRRGMAYEAGAAYEDAYNELNRPAFLTAHAGVTWHGKGFDIGLYGTNLTNAYDDRFTLQDQGRPYGGIDGPLPTDAFSLQGRAFTLVLTRRY